MAKIERKASKPSIWKDAYKGIMSGISHMIPVVIIAGMTLGLLNLIFSYAATHNPDNYYLYRYYYMGANLMGYMLPVLAGYIAYGIAGKPALVPGLMGGMVAKGGTIGSKLDAFPYSGFFGAVIAGVLAGFVVRWLMDNIKFSRTYDSLKVLFIVPLVSSIVVGLAMLFVFGPFFGAVNDGLTEWLKGMSTTNLFLAGLIFGGMAAFDYGGPINKVAFATAVGLFTTGEGMALTADGFNQLSHFVAAFAAGKTVPGVSLMIATYITPKYWTAEERAGGIPAAILSVIGGITEPAIPYALRDPLVVIPSTVVGGAIASGLIAQSKIYINTSAGTSVLTSFITSNPMLWLLYFAIGVAITTTMLVFGKKLRNKPVTEVEGE
jgi:fructose-specific phosphotransferase system IIC component